MKSTQYLTIIAFLSAILVTQTTMIKGIIISIVCIGIGMLSGRK